MRGISTIIAMAFFLMVEPSGVTVAQTVVDPTEVTEQTVEEPAPSLADIDQPIPSSDSDNVPPPYFLDENEIEKEAPKSKTFVVFIDPGHGGEDLGAKSSKTILEKNITLAIALNIRENLEKLEGITVIASRLDDKFITTEERIDSANIGNADLFISIHVSASPKAMSRQTPVIIFEPTKNGAGNCGQRSWRCQNSQFNNENRKIGALLSQTLHTATGRKVDIIEAQNVFIGAVASPAVIIEPIDFANPEDEMRLDDSSYTSKVAQTIVLAVTRYIEWKRGGGNAH